MSKQASKQTSVYKMNKVYLSMTDQPINPAPYLWMRVAGVKIHISAVVLHSPSAQGRVSYQVLGAIQRDGCYPARRTLEDSAHGYLTHRS